MMKRMIKPREEKASTLRQWDEQVVDEAYHTLIDSIGYIIDQSVVTGCRRLIFKKSALDFYFSLLQTMESELLVQWKLKQEKGMEAMLARQKDWLHRELRSDDGFFSLWNLFRAEIWESFNMTAVPSLQDPWKSTLLLTISDADALKDIAGDTRRGNITEVLKPICSFFKKLYETDPYHQALSFLNLIELGTETRPEIPAIGTSLSDRNRKQKSLSALPVAFANILEKGDWSDMPERLTEFWKSNSGGIYSCYPAFIVKRKGPDDFTLEGVVPEKQISFDDLIGIDENIKKLVNNTDHFLNQRFAHHVFLWGGRGTGKSSSVLALVNDNAEKGLRLLEIRQDDLDLIPAISNRLKNRPERFILFCDDLSFDQQGTEYKHLKTILEGSVFSPAKNLLIIATANRKDLVIRGELDERFPEQKQLIDEKRAIDDRFGLKLFYETPVFKQLEEMLYISADKTGITYDRTALFKEFRRFAQRNNHDQPSGRTVQQFISEWQQDETKKPELHTLDPDRS